ncbi:hypothetical protein YC2023_067116 [Brassica napus]
MASQLSEAEEQEHALTNCLLEPATFSGRGKELASIYVQLSCRNKVPPDSK